MLAIKQELLDLGVVKLRINYELFGPYQEL